MQLLPNEEKILTANENKLILTNQRIQLNSKEDSSSQSIVFFLEDIGSVETLYKNDPIFLILAVISGMIGIGSSQLIACIIIGLVLLIFWTLSRKKMVTITSNSGRTISIDARHLSAEQIEYFLNKVQAAKAERIISLNKARFGDGA